MIKVSETIKTNAYWKNDHDIERKRIQEKKVTFWGITIWHVKYDYDCHYDEDKTNGCGFKK